MNADHAYTTGALYDLTGLTESALLERVLAVVRSCGVMLQEARSTLRQDQVSFKDRHNLVTTVDIRCEELLVQGLGEICSEIGFQTEEGVVASQNTGWRWIIDPIDGTTNFVHGLPFFAISVALAKDSDLFLGVVHAPCLDELFVAVRGGGAFLNGRKIQVSTQHSMEDALLATGFPYYRFDRMEAYMEALAEFMKTCRGIRRMGSAALDLAYVASGRFDAYFEHNLQPWDVAAGIVLVTEAGGRVGCIREEYHPLDGREIVASGSELFQTFSKSLAGFR